MLVELFELKQEFSFTTYEESIMESKGWVNENVILRATPRYFHDGMKNIKGTWYQVRLDYNKPIGILSDSCFITEKTFKKLGGRIWK